MSEAKCKMSVYIEELNEYADVCAMFTHVCCSGSREDGRNCPFWKGAGEP